MSGASIAWTGLSAAALCAAGLVWPEAAHAAPRDCSALTAGLTAGTRFHSAMRITGGLAEVAQIDAGEARSAISDKASLARLHPFCRVTATLSPVAGSHIGIELWLPDKWNGKLLGLGNHGFAGEYERGYMAMGLERGYAVVTTDTGHSSRVSDTQAGFSVGRATFSGFNIGSAAFAVGNPVAVDDFAWRSIHEMTVAAKLLVGRYYGTKARRAYFDGCSTGGRQGMREVQQFPDDYDGVIAGGAPMQWTRVIGSGLHYYLAGFLPSGARLTSAKLAVAQRGAVAACDAQDGLTDGLIADPMRCHFDPKSLVCRPGQPAASCLTAEEGAAIEGLERPLVNPSSREVLYSPLPPGGESHWRLVTAFNPVAAAHFRYLVMNDPEWAPNARTDLWGAIARSESPGSPALAINTISRDLSRFRARGGKLIQYHGWADEAMAAGFYPKYYGEVVNLQPDRDKLAVTQDFYRLFMAPGMTHCNGGDGPVNFGGLNHVPSPVRDARHDLLEALDLWVERGVAPKQIIATEFANNGGAKRQMPLCPWPRIAFYAGGDSRKAESFACRTPLSTDGHRL